jgi:hypothetical protein
LTETAETEESRWGRLFSGFVEPFSGCGLRVSVVLTKLAGLVVESHIAVGVTKTFPVGTFSLPVLLYCRRGSAAIHFRQLPNRLVELSLRDLAPRWKYSAHLFQTPVVAEVHHRAYSDNAENHREQAIPEPSAKRLHTTTTRPSRQVCPIAR